MYKKVKSNINKIIERKNRYTCTHNNKIVSIKNIKNIIFK